MLGREWLPAEVLLFQELTEAHHSRRDGHPRSCEHCWNYAQGLYRNCYLLALRILQQGMSLTKAWKIKVRRETRLKSCCAASIVFQLM